MKLITFKFPVAENVIRIKFVENLGEIYTHMENIPSYLKKYNIIFSVDNVGTYNLETYEFSTRNQEDLFKFVIKITPLLWPED